MSSGSYKPHRGFNSVQIKDGWIVRLYKDGRIKSKIEPYTVKQGELKNGKSNNR